LVPDPGTGWFVRQGVPINLMMTDNGSSYSFYLISERLP
jgi:hypothetical protein